jgi:CO/xanthine dehydrogenase Mo-binding subunit
LRDHLSGIFKLPCSRIRIIVPYVGGGYGGKLYVKAEPIAVALTWMTRRPVKLQLSINESFKTVTRHPGARHGEDRGDQRTASSSRANCQVYMDTGAYADAGPRVTQKAGYRALGPYRTPYAKGRSVRSLYQHCTRRRVSRFRRPASHLGLRIADGHDSPDRLGLDPLEFRIKNLLKKGDLYTVGDTPVDCDLKEGLLKVADAIKWSEKSRKPNRAKGISCCIKDAGGNVQSRRRDG